MPYPGSRDTGEGNDAYHAARYEYNGNSYLYRILSVCLIEICQPVRTIRQPEVQIICDPGYSIHVIDIVQCAKIVIIF